VLLGPLTYDLVVHKFVVVHHPSVVFFREGTVDHWGVALSVFRAVLLG
jgi:hypothetical protein